MVWERLKPVAFYFAELLSFIIIVLTSVGFNDVIGFNLSYTVTIISFGIFRSIIFKELPKVFIFARNFSFVFIFFFLIAAPSLTIDTESVSEYLSIIFGSLDNPRFLTLFVGGFMLLCCGNYIGIAARPRVFLLRGKLSGRKKNSGEVYERGSDDSSDKSVTQESNATVDPSEIEPIDEPNIEPRPPVDMTTPVHTVKSDDTKVRERKKSPEEIARDLELHRTRIDLIRGYLTAIQPLLVFLAGIIGSVLMYLGTR